MGLEPVVPIGEGDDPCDAPMRLQAIANGFGLYIHIPFCTTRCDYCAFATWTGREDSIDRYVDAVCLEIERAKTNGWWRTPDTVFFGGGTPSLLSVEQIAKLLHHAEPHASAEITMECNPESTSAENVAGAVAHGVNRISLGVQSRKRHVLAGLGRVSVEGALEQAIEAIDSAGISNLNVDLIYGGHGETTADFVESLTGVLNLGLRPSHISAYALTIEPGTPLSKSPERHPDEDLQAERYEVADQLLSDYGYRWYEISNWSLPGSECQHNLSCWLGGQYLGVGCAAHSHLGGERFANVFALDRYLEAISSNESAEARRERLDDIDRARELLELTIRTTVGVPVECLEASAIEDGLAEVHGTRAVLTVRGRLLANEVALRLRPELLASHKAILPPAVMI